MTKIVVFAYPATMITSGSRQMWRAQLSKDVQPGRRFGLQAAERNNVDYADMLKCPKFRGAVTARILNQTRTWFNGPWHLG